MDKSFPGVHTANVYRGDKSVFNWADNIANSTDSFGMRIAQNTSNVADIGSHYEHSPERHRLWINGSRFNLQYNSTAKFEDTSDSYILKPSIGDTMVYRTAERFRYTVGYVSAISAALQSNQSLQGDDKIIFCYGDSDLSNDMANANGWFWEWVSSGVSLTTYRDGAQLDSTSISPEKAITIWQRIEDRINWYNAGNREARQTYTDNGDQINELVGKTSVDDSKGPSRGNFPIELGVQCDTSGLQLEIGSQGVSIFGSVDPIYRVKEAIQTGSHTGGGQWEAIFAIRQDPDNPNVFLNLSDIQILEISQDVDIELLAISVDPSNTDASGWGTPIYHSESNSAVQETTSVTTFPDSTGTVDTSASNPGGFQLGLAAYFVAGTGMQRREERASGIRKRGLTDTDVIIFLAKTSTAIDITAGYETEQQY